MQNQGSGWGVQQGAVFFHNSHQKRVENYPSDNKNVEGYSGDKAMHNMSADALLYFILKLLNKFVAMREETVSVKSRSLPVYRSRSQQRE